MSTCTRPRRSGRSRRRRRPRRNRPRNRPRRSSPGPRLSAEGVGDMPKRERVMRMSVEQPLWRALTAYRVLTMLYAVGLFATAYDEYDSAGIAIVYYVVLFVWTLATLPRVQSAAAC